MPCPRCNAKIYKQGVPCYNCGTLEELEIVPVKPMPKKGSFASNQYKGRVIDEVSAEIKDGVYKNARKITKLRLEGKKSWREIKEQLGLAGCPHVITNHYYTWLEENKGKLAVIPVRERHDQKGQPKRRQNAAN